MKLAIFFSLAFLLACSSPSAEEEAILQHVSTVFDTKVELKAKIHDLSYARPILAADSAILVYKDYKSGTASKEDYLAYYDRVQDTLADAYLCTYSINNPFLNGERQEITTYFVLQNGFVRGRIDTTTFRELSRETEVLLKQ